MFDLDGTLVDTMFAFADLAADMMAKYHRDDVGRARARYLETSGVPFEQQLELIHPGHRANRACSDEFEARKLAICATTPMDDRTIAALEELRTLGVKLVLSSNTGQDVVDDFVSREPFSFDLALGFDANAGLAKGRPHVERTLATFEVAPTEIWFVGDSLKDGELARDTGLHFFGRLGTFSAADFERRQPGTPTIAHVDELARALTAQPARSVA
jgi:phosphoglycolate phosphatase-like HAD superfamily hydrolase